CQQHDNAPWTF
nr:immunoglobulin light chain junction region [Macaca mulatta]MOV77856.1 immunoglobulin light chain junction region [Macaca mulatta]MOV78051.1 immunoglobulin light chain junction region [Macaca mulatta]MOV78125.1 immunoglobulin light chain junction region [Macaca mulatta]MOV79034.1 immunoglobulin light chain junction region [Macaca mulatta]